MRLPYDILTQYSAPVYNVNEYAKKETRIPAAVCRQLQMSHSEMVTQQHAIEQPVTLQAVDTVMKLAPETIYKI